MPQTKYIDTLISSEIEEHLNNGGHRLGGKGARKDLAGLARAGRRQRESNTFESRNERDIANEEYELEYRTKFAIMFHLYPVNGGKRNVDEFDIQYFTLNEPSKNCTSPAWTAIGKNRQYNIVCLWYSDSKIAGMIWDKYSTKSLGQYRKCFHAGEQWYIHALSKEEHPETFTGMPFKQYARTVKPYVPIVEKAPTIALNHIDLDEIDRMDFPGLLDILGENIVQVNRTFESYRDKTRKSGNPVIASSGVLKLAFRELRLKVPPGIKISYPVDICAFCKLVAKASNM